MQWKVFVLFYSHYFNLFIPSGTAAADIFALLRNFCDNTRTAKVTSTSKVLQKTYFHHSSFEVLVRDHEKCRLRPKYCTKKLQKITQIF